MSKETEDTMEVTELLRALDSRIARIENGQDRMHEKVDKVIVQTTKHNGRMSSLERMYHSLKEKFLSMKEDIELNTLMRLALEQGERAEQRVKKARRWWLQYILEVGKFVIPAVIGVGGYAVAHGFFG